MTVRFVLESSFVGRYIGYIAGYLSLSLPIRLFGIVSIVALKVRYLFILIFCVLLIQLVYTILLFTLLEFFLLYILSLQFSIQN